MSIRAFLARAFRSRRPTLERAISAYAEGSKADAAVMFRALAEGGSAQAQLRLGQMYERGEGVLQSFVEATRWLRCAAEQASVPAMARLGEIYLTGLAAPETASPAALQQLQDKASGEASLLKRLYPKGLSVSQDLSEAAHWNSRAAAAGHEEAQARLGYQFATGLGLAKNLVEAERWFAASAEQGCAAGNNKTKVQRPHQSGSFFIFIFVASSMENRLPVPSPVPAFFRKDLTALQRALGLDDRSVDRRR